ncbi:p-hydroxybenzoic acid efflux subunit AaeB [Citrobacter koseri]|uniref:p-hydroxybenzoic acid efflux subunit AaeB n=1 Tax=Citrobacter koseri TaxID=545 RepID=A0A2X2WI89_CITKO|nr:p-hydroxybenzoic acid efflux subunit AaeB [Citrobacter koseri]
MGALASTINIIVLDNPMTFHFSQFLDSALGQIVGCMMAFIVILLVRDNSRDRTGRVLLNQFVFRSGVCNDHQPLCAVKRTTFRRCISSCSC